jgi:hypothetical protein
MSCKCLPQKDGKVVLSYQNDPTWRFPKPGFPEIGTSNQATSAHDLVLTAMVKIWYFLFLEPQTDGEAGSYQQFVYPILPK